MDFAYDVSESNEQVRIFMTKDNKITQIGAFLTDEPHQNAQPFLEAIGNGIVRALRKAKREKLMKPTESHAETSTQEVA